MDATSAAPLLRRSIDGPIATLTLNRPDKRNALSDALLEALRTALDELAGDDAVRAVVLAAQGPVFCAGADLSGAVGLSGDEAVRAVAPIARRIAESLRRTMHALLSFPKPVVGAVAGHAAGGGVILALGCDFRIAADDAAFWMPEVNFGRAIALPSMQMLEAHVGPALVREMVMTGQRYDAATMRGFGLLTAVAPRARVADEAAALARTLAGRDPAALATIKQRGVARLLPFWAVPTE